MTAAHDQAETHRYTVHYPDHQPRQDDPHYRDFEAYRRRTKDTAKCAMALATLDARDCAGGLELHHSHIEFALANEVDLGRMEHLYPGVSNPDEIGAWVESGDNLEWLCEFHHRGHGGVHVAAAADFEAEKFVRNLIS